MAVSHVPPPLRLCAAKLRRCVAENLHQCLELRRVTIVHTADRLAISRPHFQRILAGQVSVRLPHLATIAAHLAVDPADLVGQLPDELPRVDPSQEPLRRTLARNTRACMRERGFSPLELVRRSCLCSTTVYKLLAGLTGLDVDRLAWLAFGLETTSHALARA